MESIINLKARIKDLQKRIAELEQFLRTAPEGTLFSRQSPSGKYTYFKWSNLSGQAREIYLRKDQLGDAAILAKKMIVQKELEDLRTELLFLQRTLTFRTGEKRKDHYIKSHQGIAQLAAALDSVDQDPLTIWKNQPYRRNRKHPENLIYPTVVPNLLVRSKSEADIISRMEHFNVPYHYDEIRTFGKDELAIDLICRNVRTHLFWFWDHKGLMDNPDYIKKSLYCDSVFANAGIIQGVNLIVTTETRDHPLDIQWVDLLIQHYLL